MIHGGDIYRNDVDIDFSVNVNPLGIPETVKKALYHAVEQCDKYPDIETEKLKKSVSAMHKIPQQYLLFGNGASELFMAIVHAMKPNKTVIPVPSFYGYEYAAKASEGEIIYYQMPKENGFHITEHLNTVLTEDVDLLFIANPNNPTGNLIKKEDLLKILYHCSKKGIYVVLDECFIDFSGKEYSMISEIETFTNLILIRAFTKIFTIPGVRIGYLICSNQTLLYKIKKQIPEWNVSCFAQQAGCACALEKDFITKTVDYIKQERQFLEQNLKQMVVFSSSANFILLYSEKELYEPLKNEGILIRDCSNFRGLQKGFYRIAVKNRNENNILLKKIGEIK